MRLRALGGVSLVVAGKGNRSASSASPARERPRSPGSWSDLKQPIPARLFFEGARRTGCRHARASEAWRAARMQMIFQDPSDSLDPLMTVGHLVAEASRDYPGWQGRPFRAEVAEALSAVGLSEP